MIYEILIRFLITVSTIYISLNLNLEYKIALSILATIYLIQYLIMLPFQDSNIYKYINLIIDISFVGLFTFLFQNPYFSLFVLPFSINFLRNKLDFNIYLIPSFIPLIIGFYISDYTEILHILIYSAIFLGIFKIYKMNEEFGNYIDSLKEKMENLYIENLIYQNSLNEKNTVLNIINLSQKLKNKKISLKSWLFGLYDVMNVDGILLFDLKKRKCITIGKATCDKEILKYITDPIEIITNSPINKKLKANTIVSITSELNNNLSAVCIFIYEEEIIDKEELFEILKDYLDIYYCK